MTSEGLEAQPHFFTLLFPAMLGVLVTFRLGIYYSGKTFRRSFWITVALVLFVGDGPKLSTIALV